MSNLCKKANQKLNTLARRSSFMDLSKRLVMMKAYINSICLPPVSLDDA